MITSYAESLADLAKAGAEKAKAEGKLGECGKMCHECAFKWDQPHTLQYFLAADQAAGMLMSGGSFHCHTHDYKDAGKPCAGFLLAKMVYSED